MDRDYRYAPIPPPPPPPPPPIFHSRVSSDKHQNQDFYHHHHHDRQHQHQHQHQYPPPAPPLRHPPRIPFPTEEESTTRASVFNLDHPPPPPPPPPLPPRVSDHQPYIPSFYREENHFPDVWGDRFQNLEPPQPHRFHPPPPVDDDLLTRPSPYSMGSGGGGRWDHRDVVVTPTFNSSSYPSDLSSNEYLGLRFGGEDHHHLHHHHHHHLQEGGGGGGRLLFTGEYSRDDIGYHSHRIQNQDNLASTSGHLGSGSGYGFLRDDQDPSWKGEETVFEERYRKWNSSSSRQPPPPPPPAFHHSQLDIENEEEEEMGSSHWLKNKVIRAVTGKRFPHQSNKSSTVGKKEEGSQEFVRTPKNKVQRTSALLRLQLENPTNKKLRDEKKLESNSVPSCGEPESVDIDVSFKSNALVAKAKPVPSSSMVGPYKGKPNIKKRQNSIPVSTSSASHVTKSHEGQKEPLNGDNNATQGAGATSGFFKGLAQSKDAGSRSFKGFKEFMDAVADSGVVKTDNSIAFPQGLGEASRSFKGLAPSKDAGTDVEIVKFDNNSSQSHVFGKPQSKDAIMDVERFIDDIIKSQSHVIAKTQLKDKVAGAGTIALDHVDSLPCVNEVEQLKDEVKYSGVVKVERTSSTHGVGATPRSIKGSTQSKDAGLRSFKGFTQSNDEVIAAAVKVDNVYSHVAAPKSFKGKTPSKDATTDAGIAAVSKNSSQPRVKRKRQSKDVTRDIRSIVTDPIGSRPHVHGKTQSKDITDAGTVTVDKIGSKPCVNKITKSKDAVVEVGRIGSTGSTPSVGAGSRSFKGLTQSKVADSKSFKGFKELMDAVTDSGVVKSDEIGCAHGMDATSSSFKGLTTSKEAGTDVGIVEVDNNSSQSSVNRTTQSKDVIADVGGVIQDIIGSQSHLIEKTQSKDTALDVGIVTAENLGSLPCVNETNVPLEHGRVVGSFPTTLAGSDGSCAPKVKKKRNRKKKVRCPNSALSSQVTEVHEGSATADSMAFGADATMSTDIRLTVLEAKVTDAGAAVKCAPKTKKKKKRKKKVGGPSPCLSTRLIDANEGSVNGDSTTRGADATASSNGGLAKLETKATNAGVVAVKMIGVHPRLNGVNVSLKNVAIKESPSSHMVCSSGLSTAKVRTKRSFMLSSFGSSNSRVTETYNGSINVDIPMDGVNAASTSEKGIMRIEEKTVVSGHGTIDDIGLQPLNCSTKLLENSAVVGLSPSHMMGSEDTPSSKKGRKSLNPRLGSTRLAVAKLRESPLNAVRTTRGTAVGLSTVKGPRHSEEKVADSSNGIMDDICEATLTDGVNVASTSDKGLTMSKENNAASCDIMMDDIDLDPLNCSTAVLNNSAVVGLSPSCMMGSKETPGTKKRRKLMNPLFPSRSMVPEIDEEPINTICSTRDTDSTLSSQKGQTHSEEKLVVSSSGIVDTSQLVHAVISPFEDVAMEQSFLAVASDGAYTPKVKQPNRKIAANADTSNNCTRSTSISEKALMQPEEKAISTIAGVQSVGSQPSDVSTVPLENRVEVGSAVVVEEDVGIYAHPNLYSNSLYEESTFPIMYSPSMGSKGSQHVVNPVVTLSNCQKYNLQSDFTELESGGQREGETQMDAAEHDLFSRLSSDDIGLHSQMDDKLNFSPLEVRNSVLDERLASKALENDSVDLLVNDELLSVPDNMFSKPGDSDIFIVDPSVGMERVSDRAAKVVSQPSLPMVPELPSLNSKPTHFYRPRKKGSDTNNKPDEKDEKLTGITGNTSSILDPNFKVKSDQVIQDYHIVPEGTQSSASQGTRQPSPPIQKPAGGVFVGKNTHGSSPRQKALPVRATLASSSLKVSSSSYIAKPRTWNRTDNSSSFPHQKQYVKSGSSVGQPESGKLQSTSYIRKGNSLVRKCTPVATVSQGSHCFTNSGYQFSPLSRVELKKSVTYEKKVNSTKPLDGLSIGVERHKKAPLAHNTKFLNSTIKYCQEFACNADPLIEGSSEATNPTKLEEIKDAPKVAGASEDEASANMTIESQGIPNDGKLKSPEMKRVIYVKRKSNQLVATHSTELCDSSANVAEKTQELSCSISYDQYYKRNKNQLIRNVQTVQSRSKHPDSVPGDNSNPEGQRPPKVASLKFNRNLSRQRPDRNLFPWKRMIYWKHNTSAFSNKTSSSLISKKLLLSRKRDTVYTRSTGGFSLRKSRVLSIGGSNLKWSKSIENRSKKANEEATLAVAAVEKKKREQKTAAYAVASAKKRNQSSRKSVHNLELHSGKRIFRIGSVRYKMDPSKRTLQRISDENSAGAVGPQSGKDSRKSFIPKRLLIGNDEYIRIGNGNQLVRDPKKRIRILASEKIRWSLHTARLRLARKQQYCQFFTRFGKCNKEGGKCPYIHDPAKIAVCTKFLKGLCSDTNCKLTHKVIPERMQDCSYFLQGLCSNENCPYRHVNVNPGASVCEGFLRGFCADGNECRKKHTYVCPVFQATGECPQGSSCKLHHPRIRNKTQKRKRSKDTKKISNGRYFGSTRHIDETGRVASDKHMEQQNNEDIVFHDGKFADYISLDISDEEAEESNEMVDAHTNMWGDSDSSDIDELIKPVALMNKKPRLDNIFSWQSTKAVAGQN